MSTSLNLTPCSKSPGLVNQPHNWSLLPFNSHLRSLTDNISSLFNSSLPSDYSQNENSRIWILASDILYLALCSLSLTRLQSHWSFLFSNTPSSGLISGFCTCTVPVAICPQMLICPTYLLFRSHLQCHFLQKVFPDHLAWRRPPPTAVSLITSPCFVVCVIFIKI